MPSRSITDTAIRKIVEDSNKDLKDMVADLVKLISIHEEKNEEFKRKLQVQISIIRELDKGIADRVDHLVKEWDEF